jgi:type III secretory pathway component EscR
MSTRRKRNSTRGKHIGNRKRRYSKKHGGNRFGRQLVQSAKPILRNVSNTAASAVASNYYRFTPQYQGGPPITSSRSQYSNTIPPHQPSNAFVPPQNYSDLQALAEEAEEVKEGDDEEDNLPPSEKPNFYKTTADVLFGKLAKHGGPNTVWAKDVQRAIQPIPNEVITELLLPTAKQKKSTTFLGAVLNSIYSTGEGVVIKTRQVKGTISNVFKLVDSLQVSPETTPEQRNEKTKNLIVSIIHFAFPIIKNILSQINEDEDDLRNLRSIKQLLDKTDIGYFKGLRNITANFLLKFLKEVSKEFQENRREWQNIMKSDSEVFMQILYGLIDNPAFMKKTLQNAAIDELTEYKNYIHNFLSFREEPNEPKGILIQNTEFTNPNQANLKITENGVTIKDFATDWSNAVRKCFTMSQAIYNNNVKEIDNDKSLSDEERAEAKSKLSPSINLDNASSIFNLMYVKTALKDLCLSNGEYCYTDENDDIRLNKMNIVSHIIVRTMDEVQEVTSTKLNETYTCIHNGIEHTIDSIQNYVNITDLEDEDEKYVVSTIYINVV